MTSLQQTCDNMAVAQSRASNYRMARIHTEQAAARAGKPAHAFSLRMGVAVTSFRLGTAAEDFSRVVLHRAAANESMMEPEAA